MSIFGFSTDTSGGGDFLPIVKYDARAGRVFRTDRENDGQNWVTEQVDITRTFKAQMDLENLETGWLDFNAGGAPVFSMVKIGDPLPPRPTPNAKNGVRIMIKLTSECGGEKRIREIASSAKAFLAGIEELYISYKADADANPGKLPIVALRDTFPIKSGTGEKQSTNYRPIFEIVGWAPRGDLVFQPKNGGSSNGPAGNSDTAANMAARSSAPATGSTRVEAPEPKAKQPEMADADDFG